MPALSATLSFDLIAANVRFNKKNKVGTPGNPLRAAEG